jgi:hypothetical protein
VLGGRVEILVLGATLTPVFVSDLSDATLVDNRRELLAVAARGKDAPLGQRLELARKLSAVPLALHNIALARAAAARTPGTVYLDRPNILNHRARLRVGEGGQLLVRHDIDVVANSVAIRPGPGKDPFAARLEQGVVDTAAEAAVVTGLPGTENTTDVFRAAAAAGVTPLLVRTRDEWATAAPGATASLAPDVAARVAADLDGGYVVVLPSKPVKLAGADRTGWWRVDPRTGETIGVMDSGLHQAGTEDPIVRTINNLAAANGRTVLFGTRSGFQGMRYGQFISYIGSPGTPATQVIWNMLVRIGFFL